MSEDEIGVDVVIENEEGSIDIQSDVLKGDKGDKGDPTATIEINQVLTGEAGTEAKIDNIGTDVNMKLNITIPRGDTGEQGEPGHTPIKGTDYFTESEIQQIKSDILADVSSFDLEVVTTLPTENIKEKTIYLVPNSKQAENNIYDEYIYVNNNWEIVGSTAIDPENLKDSVPIGAIIEYDGDTVPDGYEEVEENEIIVSPTEPTGNNRKKVWIQKGKNLFNKNDAQIANNLGKYQMNGTVQYNTDYTYLKLSYKEEKQLTYSGCNNASGVNVIIFNFYKDTTFLSQSMFTSSSGTITIPSTCNNFTFSFPYADKETVQIESGNVSTEHEEYIEPKIYVKNGNDVYEEFMKKEEIETITNDNGTAIKFPDGTMICSIIKDFTTDDTYGAFSWTFPETFIDKPAVTILAGRPSNSSVITNNINDLTKNGVQLIIRKIYNNLQSNNLISGSAPNLTLIYTCLMAIGRWK